MISSNKNNNNEFLLSIIVPMHNAENKMGLCLDSLMDLENRAEMINALGRQKMEIIFIDDKSSDETYSKLSEAVNSFANARLLQTDKNTGSPSTPRNIGIESSHGDYLFFLDGDDEIDAVGIAEALSLAVEHGHDLVRGSVQVYYRGERRTVIDRIDLAENLSVDEIIVEIAKSQSLNCSALWSKSLLEKHGIRFDAETRMGEDLMFTAAAMNNARSIGYVDHPLFHYVRQPGGGMSAMHYFSGRELRELVKSWQAVEDSFASRGLSYIELHGDRTINYALRLVIRHHDIKAIVEEDLRVFIDFFQRNASKIRKITLSDLHVSTLADALMGGAVGEVLEELKPRLLIAGHDLKFIKPAVPLLRKKYQVQIDEWPSEVMHDARNSRRRLEWADYIWVEWLTAASVWYAERVKPTQKLVVRMHRYELGRSYGDQIKRESVAAIIAIAPHCLEDLIERFEFDRSKIRFIPNFYFTDSYKKANPHDMERVFKLAIIGSIPQRKGYLKALELLEKLKLADSRYSLSVLGKSFSDLRWVAGDPLEQAYFAACDRFIEQNDLSDSIEYLGWSNTYDKAADFGFVLSMSEHEGSHVGPGEAFCAGNQGIFLPWRGVEYVYPENSVFRNVNEMAEYVLKMRDIEMFNDVAFEGQRFMRDNYDIEHFVNRVEGLFKALT